MYIRQHNHQLQKQYEIIWGSTTTTNEEVMERAYIFVR